MEKNLSLYFVAIIPPDNIQTELTHIKLHFKNKFDSQHALNSPPHITLFPPFWFNSDEESQLVQTLNKLCSTFDVFWQKLSGFGSFPPKVIYVGVKENNELSNIQAQLSLTFKDLLKSKTKQKGAHYFSPHVTVAFRDLTIENFRKAWKSYKHKKIRFQFKVEKLGLLKHNGKKWEVIHEGVFKS